MGAAESCRRVLEIEIPQAVVKKRGDEIAAEFRRRARLPGFRPGKAPLSLVRQRYRDDIRSELLRDLVPEYVAAETKERKWDAVSNPSVSDIEFADDSPLKFKATLEVIPEIELKDYSGLEIEMGDTTVTEKEVDDTLHHLQEEGATYVNVDEARPVQDGDFASIALREISAAAVAPASNASGILGTPQTHELLCEIGSERTVKEFTENLRGAALGEERSFTVSYPPEFSDSRLAGKTVSYHVKVLGIKKKQLPELNDDFARELGDFESLAIVRQHIREDLSKAKEREAEQKAKDQLRNKLAELHDFPVPETLVERQVENRLNALKRQLEARGLRMDLDWGRMRAAQRQEAAVDVKSTLILEKIAEANSLNPERAEIDREIRKIAAAAQQSPEATEVHLTRDGRLDKIKSSLRIEKALEFVFQHVRRESSGIAYSREG